MTRDCHAEKALIQELPNTEFRPIFSRLSQQTGISPTTLYSAYQKMNREGRIRITIEVGTNCIAWTTIKQGPPK